MAVKIFNFYKPLRLRLLYYSKSLKLFSIFLSPEAVGIGQSPENQTCGFEICNFHFHYGSNLTSSGSKLSICKMLTVPKKLGEYYTRCVLYAKNLS